MSDFIDRTRKTIDFISPLGNTFSALWAGNNKPQAKKLGIFDFPLIDGQVVQDLGVIGNRYPITIYFEGPNNDIVSANFQIAFRERGLWTVIHPVEGNLTLQPISINPNTDPVGSGNLSVIESEWLEPVSDAIAQSSTELEANIEASRNDLNIASANAAETNIKQDTTAERLEIKSAAEFGNNSIIANLSNIYNQSAEVAANVTTTLTGIQDTIDQTVIDTLSLAGQINQAVQTPALAVNDFTSRLTSYGNMIGDLFNNAPAGILPEDKSSITTTEQYLNATIGAIGIIATTSDFKTVSEIVQAIKDIESLFLSVINGLETTQVNFQSLAVDLQYFTFLETYGNISIYFGEIIAYLLRTSLSLKVEKRFKITSARSPWEIALTEYGGPGDNDSNLDLFVLTNGLKANDILLLPSGREVVVYV